MPKVNISTPQVDEDFEDHLDDVYAYDVETYIEEKQVPWMQDAQVYARERKKAYYLSFFSLPTDWEYMLVNLHVQNQDFIDEDMKFWTFEDDTIGEVPW